MNTIRLSSLATVLESVNAVVEPSPVKLLVSIAEAPPLPAIAPHSVV